MCKTEHPLVGSEPWRTPSPKPGFLTPQHPSQRPELAEDNAIPLEFITVTSEIGFRFLLTLQLSEGPVLGLLALTPCLLLWSNLQYSPAQCGYALLT
jgi:hypothetical protein